MKYLLFIITCLFMASINSLPQSRVESGSFYSPALGISKAYIIYLPNGYDESPDRYPVVYFFRNRETEWFNTTWRPNGRALKEVADDLISFGLIGPMILVGPNSGSNSGTTQYYGVINMLRPDLAPSAGIGTGMFEDYLISDLVTHVDTTYRTLNDRNNRGVDGFSMGGYASTVLSFKHPDLFSSVGAFDGTLMFYNLEDPGDPGPGPDDRVWMNDFGNEMFDVPRNIPYMLEHNVVNILEAADVLTLNQLRENRYHISTSYIDGAGNYIRNIDFVDRLKQKGIRNSWGNPIIHHNAIHTYETADVHATASLIKHWQTFNGTKISTPTLIDFSITESTGKDHNVIIFNYGPGSLTVNSIQTNTSEFSLIDLPTFPITILPGNDSISFSVRFIPTLNQFYNDTMYIFSDDPMTPIAKTILRGKGGSFKAEPGKLYAASTSALYLINIDSVNASVIGNFGNEINYIKELGVDPVTNELFGFGAYSSSIYDVDLINARGGDGFWFQNIDCTTSTIAAAKIGVDSVLYLGNGDGKIYTVDYRSSYWAPPLNLIMETGIPITALAFNYSTGELWAAAGAFGGVRDKIYKINMNNGDTTYIGTAGVNKTIDDLVFDSQGILYGLVGSGSGMDTLIIINKKNGIATKLGSLTTNALVAIAISPESPSGVIVQQDIPSPEEYYLAQNYPNPFNSTSVIKYSIPKSSQVSLKIFNVLGSEIETLVNEEKPVGTYELTWNAANLPSGVYFYKIQAGNFVQTRKMILLK